MQNNFGIGAVFTVHDFGSTTLKKIGVQVDRLEGKIDSAQGSIDSSFKQMGKGLAVFVIGLTAVVGSLALAQSAEAVVSTLNVYGQTAEYATIVTDKLLRTTQLTNFQTRDFQAGLAKAAAAGATFNQSLDDVLITMGLLRNRNIDVSSSATAFRESTRARCAPHSLAWNPFF